MTGAQEERPGEERPGGPSGRRSGGRAAPGRWRGRRGRRRGRRSRGRHATPSAIARTSLVVRVLVGLALTVAGALLAAGTGTGGAAVAHRSGPQVAVVAGVALIALGGAPVADLLIRRRAELRAVAGPRPARTVPAAAVLSPVVVTAGCLWYRARPPDGAVLTAPVAVSGVLLLILLSVLGWGLSGLWRRAAAAAPTTPGPASGPGSGPGSAAGGVGHGGSRGD